MKHIVFNKEVEIEWEQQDLQEDHNSGCTEWSIQGIDKYQNEYTAIGWYQDNELIEVLDIEKL